MTIRQSKPTFPVVIAIIFLGVIFTMACNNATESKATEPTTEKAVAPTTDTTKLDTVDTRPVVPPTK
jgi:uncharacterized protein YpmB